MPLGWQIALYAAGGVGILILLISAFRNKKPLRSVFGGALQGLCALAAVDVAGAFTGVSIGLSVFSLAVSAALGIPGVIALLLLKLIFPYVP